MVKLYAVSLALGVVGLVAMIYGGALVESLGRDHREPGRRLGSRGRMVVGGLTGFGMGGLAAEFSPLDWEWPLALGVALAGAALSALWVRVAAGDDSSSDAGHL